MFSTYISHTCNSDGWYSLVRLGSGFCHHTQMYGNSVLTLAAVRGDTKLVSLLLEAGADIHYQRKVYMSAISIMHISSAISTHLPNIYLT